MIFIKYSSRHITPEDKYKQLTLDGQSVTITNATSETFFLSRLVELSHPRLLVFSSAGEYCFRYFSFFVFSPFSKQLTVKNLQISIFTADTFVMYSDMICTNI